MKRNWILTMLAGLLLAAVPSAAEGVWYVPMAEQVPAGFDLIQIRTLFPYVFAVSAMTAFSGPSPVGEDWELVFQDGANDFAVARGPNPGDGIIHFAIGLDADPQWERPAFQFQAYREGVRVDNADIFAIGPGELDWAVAPGTWPVSAELLPYLPGDANRDGKVDVGDLGILGANYGQSNRSWSRGDFNGDGLVDVGDLGILGANYGRDINRPYVVPEPATLLLMAAGAMGLTARKGRQTR